MRIRVLWEGKTKDAHLRALQSDLVSRIEHFTALTVEQLPPLRKAGRRNGPGISPSERNLLEKIRESTKVFLDERGREWSSAEFAEWLGNRLCEEPGNLCS